MGSVNIGEQLDHYYVEGVTARSGMASIFRGKDLLTGRQVAIKVPHVEMENRPEFFELFQCEEEIGLKLNHPGVMKVFSSNGRTRRYMVMEWVEGDSLRNVMKASRARGALPPEIAVCVAAAGRRAFLL